MIQAGLSKYGVIDRRILKGDDGNSLIRMKPQTGHAEGGLTEPWARVIASCLLEYRTTLKNGGKPWIIGTTSLATGEAAYTISRGLDNGSSPARVLLTDVPPGLARWLKERASESGVEFIETSDLANPQWTRSTTSLS
jgi:hypothetical protein